MAPARGAELRCHRPSAVLRRPAARLEHMAGQGAQKLIRPVQVKLYHGRSTVRWITIVFTSPPD